MISPNISHPASLHPSCHHHTQELQLAVGIDVDPAAHDIARERLAALVGGSGQPVLRQLLGNYR
jgi:hypothetical protein